MTSTIFSALALIISILTFYMVHLRKVRKLRACVLSAEHYPETFQIKIKILYYNQGNRAAVIPGIFVGLDWVFPPDVNRGYRDCMRLGQNEDMEPYSQSPVVVEPNKSEIQEYVFSSPKDHLEKNWKESLNRKIVGYIWYSVVDGTGAAFQVKQVLGEEKVRSGLRFGFPGYKTISLKPKHSLLKRHESSLKKQGAEAEKLENRLQEWHDGSEQ